MTELLYALELARAVSSSNISHATLNLKLPLFWLQWSTMEAWALSTNLHSTAQARPSLCSLPRTHSTRPLFKRFRCTYLSENTGLVIPTVPLQTPPSKKPPAWRRCLGRTHVVLAGKQDKSVLTYLTFIVTLIGIPVGIGGFLVAMSSILGWPDLPIWSFFARLGGKHT
ncbi:hypothetical protein N656DRAFT_119191 [Canariomyces notabilis]|uniref:Uncharacterized protein n=1 Tax=Canariomyces notabilis TaxID=2074819 RepID=A0AAN6YRQ6_9PEZI|nr:hypothetical protein N656DRAFT_119191 [Canariomyces arenarius]